MLAEHVQTEMTAKNRETVVRYTEGGGSTANLAFTTCWVQGGGGLHFSHFMPFDLNYKISRGCSHYLIHHFSRYCYNIV